MYVSLSQWLSSDILDIFDTEMSITYSLLYLCIGPVLGSKGIIKQMKIWLPLSKI